MNFELEIEIPNITENIEDYINVIRKFKNLAGVQSGKDITWNPKRLNQTPKFENQPKGLGDGMGTTGWCVSVSEAFLNYGIFQELLVFRNATAKLISIDIKEQFYGVCYNGSQNKWHTAILVKDSNMYFVIDLTCRQFGNNYVDKDIWDFQTWQDTFRSPEDSHKLMDFDKTELSIIPTEKVNNFIDNKNVTKSLTQKVKTKLSNVTNLIDFERALLADFLVNKIDIFNRKIITDKVNVIDLSKLEKFFDIATKLPVNSVNSGYSLLRFSNKDVLKNYLTKLNENSFYTLGFHYICDTLKDCCNLLQINYDNINCESNGGGEHYLVLKFNNITSIDTSNIIEHTKLLLLPEFPLNVISDEEHIYNGGKLISNRQTPKTTNTIFIEIENI